MRTPESPLSSRLWQRSVGPRACATLLWLLPALLPAGCSRLHSHPPAYVYVQSKGTFLRDRVAAVSNKVTDVHNAERLQVLQHERRFYQVKTDDGKIGWLEEHAVVDQDAFDKFESLEADHASDPVVATAILRDELFLHIAAGRKTDHLYLLPENDKLQLLMRASVPKPEVPGMPAPRPPVRRPHPGLNSALHPAKPAKKQPGGSTIWAAAPQHPDPYNAPDLVPPDKPLEDWWLVRDQQGHVGWVLARRIDVDVPDSVAQYSEGKKIVGAYQLNTVYDPGGPSEDDEAKAERKAAKAAKLAAARGPKHKAAPAPPPAPIAILPGRNVPQYVTVTQEYKDGLPYDWEQVRVFIWNIKKHRYETAYRLREQQGYLPVTIGSAHFKDANGKNDVIEPTFTIRTTPDGVVTQDPETGAFHAKTIERTTYRLEGGIVRRVEPPAPPKPAEAANSASGAADSAADASVLAGPVIDTTPTPPPRASAARSKAAARRPGERRRHSQPAARPAAHRAAAKPHKAGPRAAARAKAHPSRPHPPRPHPAG